MTVPSESPFYMITTLMSESSYSVLDGACKDMAIMWQTGGKRRAIIK